MADEIFADTSGFYSLLVARDDRHDNADKILRRAAEEKRRFLTTDYVLDETATLLKARGLGHLVRDLFETVIASNACAVEWMDSHRFAATQAFFLKHQDQEWSFTDCFSFQMMRHFKLREALTKDVHFKEAGFVALLL
jgi:predicted nucleic acid-binding protein